MKLPVLNTQGEKTDHEVELAENVFNIEANKHVVYLSIKQYLSNQRQGTHKAKGRSEVKHSGKKLFKQKGTGSARAGDRGSPIFRKGGVVFGPNPRDYSFKINKKVKRLARHSVLTYKAKENAIIILENFDFENIKTKNYLSLLQNLKLEGKKSLLVLDNKDDTIYLSARNIKKANVITADSLNAYQILDTDHLIISQSAVDAINKL